jgi:hypothetical protein
MPFSVDQISAIDILHCFFPTIVVIWQFMVWRCGTTTNFDIRIKYLDDQYQCGKSAKSILLVVRRLSIRIALPVVLHGAAFAIVC